MSISTPQTGGERRPSARKATATGNPPAKKAAAKSGTSSSPAKPDSATSDAAAKSDTPAKSTSAAKSGGTKAGGAKAAPAKGTSAKGGPAKGTPAKGSGAKATPAKTTGKPGGGRAFGAAAGAAKTAAATRGLAKSGRSGPVRVRQSVNWFSIGLITVVGLIAAGIVGFMGYQVYLHGQGWQKKADRISGIVDYREKDPGMLTRNHKYGVISYKVNPPVGGDHNPNWQRCQGDVYDQQIPSENAVHSLEHGAVWITYRPGLPQAQIDALKAKVTGNDFTLMSPYPGLDKPISLQAWGFQLKVDNASDPRIDEFITDLRQNAAMEPNTPCSTGSFVTGTGSQPYDLGAPPSASPSGSAAPSSAPASSKPASPAASAG